MKNMLLGYQHAPEAFHLIAHKLVPLVDYLSQFLSTSAENNVKDSENKNEALLAVEHEVVQYLLLPPPEITLPTNNTDTANTTESLSTTSRETTPPNTGVEYVAFFVTRRRSRSYCNEILQQLGRLIWVMIIKHTGYPELYSPLVGALDRAGIKSPSDSEARVISIMIAKGCWKSLTEDRYYWRGLGLV